MPLSTAYLQNRKIMATPLAEVRGVGPRLSEKLQKSGRSTIEDAIYAVPIRYEDRRTLKKISQLIPDQHQLFAGEVLAAGESVTPRARRRLYEVVVGDSSGKVALKWFRYRKGWLKQQFAVGQRVIVVGEVKRFGALREVHHPEVEFIPAGQDQEAYLAAHSSQFGRVLPVYPLTEGLSQKLARKIGRELIDSFAKGLHSPLPAQLLEKYRLLPFVEAVRQAHWPAAGPADDLEKITSRARQSLVFDEFFFLELGLALKRRGTVLEEGIAFTVTHKYTKPLAHLLPYRLTEAQRRVLGEIKVDMMAPHPMNRLVQGDVGSGKTIVALMAALVAIENGCQVAVVAPTEILAEQHYLQFHGYLEQLGLKARLLTGSMSTADKKAALEQIRGGEIDLVVGTHAVLQKGVEFKRLGLGIVDEQHRFGVRQRSVLRKMGDRPDMLVMTATPIPRTLALTAYGDLALSVIDEMPPGRSPIRTRVLPVSQKERAYRFITGELEKGSQAYIVYPLVEETEKSDLLAASEGAQLLQRDAFPAARIGLIHGRMKAEEKEEVMRSFKDGEIQILVSTTVIEVGIDVPNATVMMVEHAERFGLSQLHQLRGRVGRGQSQSYCLLMRDFRCSADAQKRLQVMAETTDGFRIAEADLEIRGPGEFLGTRQSGLPDFRIANLLRDGRLLEAARQEAFALAEDTAFPEAPEYADLKQTLLDRWGSRLELASIG